MAKYYAEIEGDPVDNKWFESCASHQEAAEAAANLATIGEWIETTGPRGGKQQWIAMGPEVNGHPMGVRKAP